MVSMIGEYRPNSTFLKPQIPSTNIQRNPQALIIKPGPPANSEFLWTLEFGAWSFCKYKPAPPWGSGEK
jgi:hypothetical protein